MLRISHLNAASQITGKLDQMGYRLLPVVNTPLSSLNADVNVAHPTNGSNDFTPNPAEYIAYANSTTPGQDVSIYTANVESTARTVARYVQSHLSFAKNVVKPLITEFVEVFTERTNSLYVSPSSNLTIEKLDLPAPMLESDLKDMIDDYSKVHFVDNSYADFKGPDLSIVEITELMKTGNKSVDAAIDAWVAQVGEEFFIQIYERSFGTVKGGYPRIHLISNQEHCWSSTLAVFLMANKLHGNPWKEVGMSLVDYNVAVAKLRDNAGNVLSNIYSIFESYAKTQTLVRTAFGNKITVVAPVYNEWIEAGNNDAVLYSILITGKRLNFVNEINAAKVDLLKAWELHSAMTISTERNRKFVTMRKTFYDTMFEIVERNADPVFSHLKSEGEGIDHVQMQEYKTFKAKFEECYTYLREEDFVDIWKLAKHVVCDMLFYYTDAGEILNGIEDACKTNPDMEVDEAALLSTIAYVTRYVCNQMTISKI
jgi:hypothetical protein